MRFFVIFMTLILLANCFDWCSDPDRFTERKISVVNKDQHTDAELCSPFCQCASCPFSVVVPNSLVQTARTTFSSTFFGFIKPGNTEGIISFVWQPPQLTLTSCYHSL